MRNWKIRVMHLSHTDVGYKDTQSNVIIQHERYLKEIVEKFVSEPNFSKEWVWNIECFGTLDYFLTKNNDDKKLISTLVELIKNKSIGVSANFWNYSELPSRDLTRAAFERVQSFAKVNGLKINSMITNDINGYSASWAEEAEKTGVENLFFGLHTHHGYFPAFKKQMPFWWKLPNGKKMFTWIGEQYAFGNNMGIVPGPMSDYITKDKVTCGTNEEDQIELATSRLKQYLELLEKDGYPFDVVPITVLGTGADNDPQNYDIAPRIKLLKKAWASLGVEDVSMVTLEDFFAEVDKTNKNIPTYEGEMPDWWSDGAGSQPVGLRAFREAHRNYKNLVRLDLPKETLTSLENDLLLYSEHTYGSEDPIREAHSMYNFQIEKTKMAYAIMALDKSTTLHGEAMKMTNYRNHNTTSFAIKVKNPFNVSLSKTIDVSRFISWSEMDLLTSWEKCEITANGKEVKYTIETIPHPSVEAWGAKRVLLHLDLNAAETLEVNFNLNKGIAKPKPFTSMHATITADWADDIENINDINDGIRFNDNILTTDFFTIEFDDNGIAQITTKDKKELLREDYLNLFAPTYFVEKIDYDKNRLFIQRRKNAKNRIGAAAEKFEGFLLHKDVKISSDKQDAVIKMFYSVESTKFYEVELTVSNHHGRILAKVDMNKDTEWCAENMFISLPFAGAVELDKDNMYKVGEGQIPGTLVDYHSVQEGMVFNKNVFVAQLDSSLVWTGPLANEQRSLAGNIKFDLENTPVHSWVLNNVWETNFPADTSGFHQFRYIIEVADEKNKSERLVAMSTNPLISREK